MNAIILAAGMSSRLRPITIVTGYRSEVIDISNVNYVKNENYETTNINESLFCALKPSNSPILVTYSDIIFEQKIVQQMLEIIDGIRLAVNLNWKKYYQNRTMHPLSEAENVLVENGRILQIRKNIPKSSQNQQIGEFLGIMTLSSEHVKILLDRYSYLKNNHIGTFHNSSSLSNAYITDMLQEIINYGINVDPVFTQGRWCEIDTPEDLKNAEKLINKL